MKKIIPLLLSLCLSAGLFAQKLVRSSMSSFGNSKTESGTTFRQTVGQPSNTSVVSAENTAVRQGFQQPLNGKANAKAQKQCTLHLNPNPAISEVTVSVKENVGANEIKLYTTTGQLVLETRNTTSANYKMDVSTLNAGIYMLNITSNSGYICHEKLVLTR